LENKIDGYQKKEYKSVIQFLKFDETRLILT